MGIVILAHGALGPFDEIIFISIAVVFVVMMAVSWFRSQQLPNEIMDGEGNPQVDAVQSNPTDTDRFKLE